MDLILIPFTIRSEGFSAAKQSVNVETWHTICCPTKLAVNKLMDRAIKSNKSLIILYGSESRALFYANNPDPGEEWKEQENVRKLNRKLWEI